MAGEAGIGKSRLLREFAAAAGDDGHRVVWGRPEAVTTPGPYSLILDLLDDLAVAVPDARADASALADAIALREEGRPEPPARQIAARVRGLFGGVAGPVVLVEDLHVADEPSQAVIAHLARTARDDGMLVVGTFRPEDAKTSAARLLDVLARDRVAREIRLSPLPSDALDAMLDAMWEGDVPDDVRADIERLGEGIPFFVEELAAARGSGATVVPESVARGTLTRLQLLDDDARGVIRVAALTTGALDPAVLARACGLPEERIPRAILDGIGAGLISEDEGRLVFRHALVREAIAGGIVSVERGGMHRALARAIEEVHAADLGPHARALATHHLEAGDREAAASYLVLAGERALGVAVPQEARATFEESLSLSPAPDVAVRATWGLAESFRRLNDPVRAAELLREVVAAKGTDGDEADAALATMRLAEVLLTNHDRASIAAARLAVERAERSGDGGLHAECLIALARIHCQFSEPEEAEEPLTAGLAIAEGLDAAHLLALGHEVRMIQAIWRRDPEARLRHAAEADRYARRSGRRDVMARLGGRYATALADAGEAKRALEVLETVRHEVVKDLGGNTVTIDLSRMLAVRLLGLPGEVESIGATLDGTRPIIGPVRLNRVQAAIELDALDIASRILGAWWDEAGGQGVRRGAWGDPEAYSETPLDLAFAVWAELILWSAGKPPDDLTIDDAARCVSYLATAPTDEASDALIAFSRIQLAGGDVASAADSVARAAGMTGASSFTQARVREAEAVVEMAAGRTEAAREAFADAAARFEAIENLGDRARALRGLAEALEASGDREGAVGTIREARDLAVAAGALREVNLAESVMRRLGLRPRAGRPRGSGRRDELSRREREVVTLVASGLSNAEIAARLFLSHRTVEDHVSHATRRLGVSRAGLAAWAAKQGLV